MTPFATGHATHPDPRMAAALVLAQLRARLAGAPEGETPTLGLVYLTDSCASQAADILALLAAELPAVTDWAGCVGIGIFADSATYVDEPALAVMLCALPPDHYRVFSGVAPLPPGFQARSALVHADPEAPELASLVAELASRSAEDLFGGLVSSRSETLQMAVGGDGNLPGQGLPGGVFTGGLSGVAFGDGVRRITRVTQGCCPVGPSRQVTRAERNLVLELDGEPALDVLLRELAVTLEQPRAVVEALRAALVGLDDAGAAPRWRTGHFDASTRVRPVIGVDPGRRGVAVGEHLVPGERLSFCRRDAAAARADLVRICAEIREELAPEPWPDSAAPAPAQRIAGAVYVSCISRDSAVFGAPGAELAVLRHALGEVPLVGFLAAGEIAGHRVLGHSGVLTVFCHE